MLTGIEIDANPLLQNPAEGKELEIVYQDEAMVVINKPAEFLSVPGKVITDSVYSRMQAMFPDSDSPTDCTSFRYVNFRANSDST